MPKLFVLDTSVLLFDHNAITNFEENDIVIPITVLEELDNFKIGNETKNYEARNVIRYLDKLSGENNLNKWIALGKGKGRLKIVMNTRSLEKDAETIFGIGKNDHKILNVASYLKKKHPKSKVTLVTKDINLRIKAKAIGLNAQDYLTGKVEDVDNIRESFPSISDLDAKIISELSFTSTVMSSRSSPGTANSSSNCSSISLMLTAGVLNIFCHFFGIHISSSAKKSLNILVTDGNCGRSFHFTSDIIWILGEQISYRN